MRSATNYCISIIFAALKHSPSKRKSLSKAIQRSIDSDNEVASRRKLITLKINVY